MSQELRLKIVDESKNYLFEETNQNDLMSEKHKSVCTTLSYIEHLLILALVLPGCVPISAFACLVGFPAGISKSSVGLDICTITAVIKIYKSIIKKTKKIHDKIAFLTKSKLKSIEALVSSALSCLFICGDNLPQ